MSQNAIQLAVPLTRGDKTIEQITLRKPDTGSLRGLAISDVMRMDVDTLADLVPRISPDITKGEFLQLDPYDLGEISKSVIDFFTVRPSI
ncbi:Uncharacterised protein [BD1-7 clade bacterium]|uniref:Phage tail protein E n=1 Tax=BD1-7 clade bacterium TaxID=2029982 RepID=A0A5S9P2N7_9GAMM|nr:Uncharacterised protein [BD1-7 clade bacterium]CAA0122817.1 Uncharacterised protein [BD1-7 clade bacterium]